MFLWQFVQASVSMQIWTTDSLKSAYKENFGIYEQS